MFFRCKNRSIINDEMIFGDFIFYVVLNILVKKIKTLVEKIKHKQKINQGISINSLY